MTNLTMMFESVKGENLWVNDNKYQSPEIVNEMIEIMVNKVMRSLLSELSFLSWFALTADETRDVSNHEQLVLCLRWITTKFLKNKLALYS